MSDTEPDEDRVVVIPVSAMGPWRLRKHINARHIPVGDFRSEHNDKVYDLTELTAKSKRGQQLPPADHRALVAYHDHCHNTYPERYFHVHR